MRILLINPKFPVYQRMPSVPLGLLSIASYLNANGHEAIIFERSEKGSLTQAVKNFKPDIIGISAMSFSSSMDAKKVTDELHARFNCPVVWGGQAASALPDLVMEKANPDYIIDGEGEITWKEFADTLENGGDISLVNGLIYKRDGKLVKAPVRPVADLKEFPDIDWTLINPETYFSTFFNCSKMLYLYASKGCPANCTFCSNRHFHQGKNRCRAPEQVMRDILYLTKNYGMDGVYFSDELWCPNRELRTQLCNRLIEENTGIVWGCQMRLGVLNEDDVKLMYKAGCRWILFGIESATKERIKSIKKSIDIDIAEETVRWCENAGITVQASFIIGFPGETKEEVRRTVEFAEKINASLTLINILIPLPNTEILAEAEASSVYKFPRTFKRIAEEIEGNGGENIPVNLSAVKSRDLKVLHFCYQWKAFSRRDSVNGDSFGIIKKMASDTFNRIFRHGLKGFVFGSMVSIRQFCTVFYYSHFFRKTAREYGVKFK